MEIYLLPLYFCQALSHLIHRKANLQTQKGSGWRDELKFFIYCRLSAEKERRGNVTGLFNVHCH